MTETMDTIRANRLAAYIAAVEDAGECYPTAVQWAAVQLMARTYLTKFSGETPAEQP